MDHNQDRAIVEAGTDREMIEKVALRIFHKLWGKQKDDEPYDKPSWGLLQLALNRLGIKV